jgi:siroheme synthase
LQHEPRTYLWDARRAGNAVLRYARGKPVDFTAAEAEVTALREQLKAIPTLALLR